MFTSSDLYYHIHFFNKMNENERHLLSELYYSEKNQLKLTYENAIHEIFNFLSKEENLDLLQTFKLTKCNSTRKIEKIFLDKEEGHIYLYVKNKIYLQTENSYAISRIVYQSFKKNDQTIWDIFCHLNKHANNTLKDVSERIEIRPFDFVTIKKNGIIKNFYSIKDFTRIKKKRELELLYTSPLYVKLDMKKVGGSIWNNYLNTA